MTDHTEPLPDTPVNRDLETLRKHLKYMTDVSVQDGYMVYNTEYGGNVGGAKFVQAKINELNLPLKVEYKVVRGTPNNTFTVTGI